jgi:hypothetical protein
VSVVEDLDLFEKWMRQLQVEWEKFFAGVERKPPVDLRTRVENLLKRYANGEIRNNAERFRYQNLTARYNTFNELWTKRLRAMEEGRPVGIHGRATAIAMASRAERLHGEAARAASRGPLLATREGVRVQSADRDDDAVRSLFERFLEARKAAGENGAVKFESFQKLIVQQTARILSEKQAQAVDYRFETKDGKVSLKAKPVR